MKAVHPSLRGAACMSSPKAAAPGAQRAAAVAAGHTSHSAAAFGAEAAGDDIRRPAWTKADEPASASPPGPQPGRLFTFGICTDVQYADLPQGFSHGGTARYYRDSLDGLRRAVQAWKGRGVDFGMHLGDVLDGKNRKDKREEALNDILDAFNALGKPVSHIIGNHCLYNFTREELNYRLDIGRPDGNSYYSFRLATAEMLQRAIVFCHQPLHPDSCTGTILAWTYQEVMDIIQRAGNVVACFAGHTHQDGYAQDEAGVHYRALSAILETPPGHDCYGFIDVYEDRLHLIGVDYLESAVMEFQTAAVGAV